MEQRKEASNDIRLQRLRNHPLQQKPLTGSPSARRSSWSRADCALDAARHQGGLVASKQIRQSARLPYTTTHTARAATTKGTSSP